MSYADALRQMHDSTSEHFLYFGLGFSSATVVWLVLVIGIVIGNYRKRTKDDRKRESGG